MFLLLRNQPSSLKASKIITSTNIFGYNTIIFSMTTINWQTCQMLWKQKLINKNQHGSLNCFIKRIQKPKSFWPCILSIEGINVNTGTGFQTYCKLVLYRIGYKNQNKKTKWVLLYSFQSAKKFNASTNFQ